MLSKSHTIYNGVFVLYAVPSCRLRLALCTAENVIWTLWFTPATLPGPERGSERVPSPGGQSRVVDGAGALDNAFHVFPISRQGAGSYTRNRYDDVVCCNCHCCQPVHLFLYKAVTRRRFVGCILPGQKSWQSMIPIEKLSDRGILAFIQSLYFTHPGHVS